jgi:small redox-active disulfide protein 2
MLKIYVLGPGCANCEKVEQHARQAAVRWQASHPDYQVEIEKVTDLDRIAEFGVLATPGVAVNDELFSSGRIPNPDQIYSWIDAVASLN